MRRWPGVCVVGRSTSTTPSGPGRHEPGAPGPVALQKGADPKVRQKQEERLQELLKAKEQHERAERERKFAKRYHKVGGAVQQTAGRGRRAAK